MTKLLITKEELFVQYKIDVNQLLDECDWIDFIEDWRMCGLISDILNKKGIIVNADNLLKHYDAKVKSLNLTTQEWRDQYADWNVGLPKIFDIIYEILENKFGSSE